MTANPTILALAALSVVAAVSPGATASSPAPLTPEQRIDQLVEAKLKQQGIQPNASIDDATFLRRIYLDIVGRIPTVEEAEDFHGRDYPNKRERLIEELLQSEGYVSHFFHFWADILRINADQPNSAPQAEAAYQLWVKRALRQNLPYDRFVRELITARGYVWDNGAVGYYLRDRGMPLDNMSNTVRIFLGTRLECAQCHNHPFDKWTQMDYYKMAAFSYGVDANRSYHTPNREAFDRYEKETRATLFHEAVGVANFPPVESEANLNRILGQRDFPNRLKRLGMTHGQFVEYARKGLAATQSFDEQAQRMRKAVTALYKPIQYVAVSETERPLKLPHDYQYEDAKPFDVVRAATPFGDPIDLANLQGGPVEAYANWMTSRDNPAFTRVIANRLWKEVFGVGIIEPVDELTDQTQPSHPELMAYLESLMRELNYDMKAYLKVLYNTRAYQRAADANEIVLGEPYHFPGPILRRMSAEQIWDSVVALAIPEADTYRPRLKEQLAGIKKIREIYESLEDRDPEEYLAMVLELGNAIAAVFAEEEVLRQKLYEARDDEPSERYAQLRAELRETAKKIDRAIVEIGYQHTEVEVDAAELLAALGTGDARLTVEKNGGGEKENARNTLTSLPNPRLPEPPADLDKNARQRWNREKKEDLQTFNKVVASMARASELESPAPRGHFLREFGQSDREVIEHAADHASVPQALHLLNGTIIEALTNPYAEFGRRMDAVGSPEEKIRIIFQAMLARQPTEREMDLARNEVATNGETAYEGLVWALLNTQQFLFVQ
ncbi:MAG: DUF1549 domain-containing protein [Verrucomicrobiales bacterium]|nr:DUF1549 domain-containing protein [Verrucomicrobiales bacterium]